ncbi:MAG TPA: hypothetical protein VM432_01145 [Bdellovibrionales bacterium]|nr:hypothetical protein [Bdellovibrionales bacterium]
MRLLTFVLISFCISIRAVAAIPQTELQQQVQRIVGESSDRITQALQVLQVKSGKKLGPYIQKRELLYGSALVEIATGPEPEANFLDLIVFFRLNRLVIKDFWIPKVFGKNGRPLYAAFAASELELWKIFDRIAPPEKKKELKRLIDQWHRDNPKQVRVEGVRFKEFSKFAAKGGQKEAASGLFASIRGVTETADSALLVAERAMFLVQKYPFLLRLQALVGTEEITRGVVTELSKGSDLVGEIRELDPFVDDVTGLTVQLRGLTGEARDLVETIKPMIKPKPPGHKSIYEKVTDMVNSLSNLTNHLDRTKLIGSLHIVLNDIDRMMRRWVLYLILIGVGWSAAIWGGYLITKIVLKRMNA